MANAVLSSNTVRVNYTGRMADGDKRERSWQAGPVRVRVTLPSARPEPRERKEPLTTERIVDAAMTLMQRDGYDSVSMRSLARELDTGPASLYAHVANKDELDQHVIDRIAGRLELPEPDAERWAEQLKDVMRETLRLYQEHPGSARAAMGMIPTMDGGLRAADGMMAIMITGGVSPQAAAWFCDLAAAYVGATAYEEMIWTSRENSTAAGDQPDHEAIDAQLREVMTSMAQKFPFMATYADELTAGDGHDRFEFGIDVLVSGLAAVSDRYR
jgi:AcrR family transcriptional regulator